MARDAVVEGERRLRGAGLAFVIACLMLTLLLEALDQTIVGTAMPRIIRELHGLNLYTWVTTIYLLASTTMIPIVGKLSDQFGRKPFLLGGVAIFLVGSALCGAAQSIEQLIVFRAVQGLGGGIGIGLVYTLVGDIFPPEERARWQGIVGTVFAFSSVTGPTFGGWLADNGPLVWPVLTDASRWRWVFYINLPLGIVAIIGLLIYLPANISLRSSVHTGWAAVRRIDFAGAVLALCATVCLFLGLTWGGDRTFPWISPQVTGTLIAAGLLYGGLVVAERRALEPILPPALFRNRLFTANAILGLLQMMALLGMSFYVPLFIQGVLGASATQSGGMMTPFSVSIPVGSFLAGIAIGALKRYQAVAILGTLIMSVGIVLLALMTPATGLFYVMVSVAVAGFGMGLIFPVVGTIALNSVEPTQMGVGSGAVRYIGQVGGAVGVTLVGAVVNQSLASGDGLDIAIQHGLLLVLAFCAAAVLAACLLRDVRVTEQQKEVKGVENTVFV